MNFNVIPTFMVKEDKQKKMSKYDKIDISIPSSSVHSNWKLLPTSMKLTFLTRELRACARASYRYDVGNGIRSLARSLAHSIGRFL